MGDLLDLQFRLANDLRDWQPGLLQAPDDGRPAAMPFHAQQLGVSAEDYVAAMELLTADGRMRIRLWAPDIGRNPDGWFEYKPGQHNIRKFLVDRFWMILTAKGKAWVDEQRRARAHHHNINTTDPVGDEAVRRTMEKLVAGLGTSAERQRILEALLSRLTWIAVQNYRDPKFLTGRARRELQAARDRGETNGLERNFYQSFLYEYLMQDPELVQHVTKASEQAGGEPDFLVFGEFPLEAKVIYPEDSEAKAKEIGLGQVAQYASRSGIGILAVLDMRPRITAQDLSQLANDVEFKDLPQKDGPNSVRIVRVRHVAGYGPPSKVR